MTQESNGDAAELFQRWFTVNQEFLRASMKALENLGKDPAHLDDAYREEVRSAREAVSKTLELEREALDAFEKQTGGTLPLAGVAEVTTSMTRSGIELRARLWDAWFDQAESLGANLPQNLMEGIAPPAAAPSSGNAASKASDSTDRGTEASSASGGEPRTRETKTPRAIG